MENFEIKDQDIISGSSRLVSSNKSFDKLNYFIENMKYNLAYIKYLEKKKIQDENFKVLNHFK